MPKRPPPASSESGLSRDAQRMGWLYATAINFVATVAVFTGAGYLLDRWFKTAPWCLIGGLVFGLVGGTIKFVRDGLAVNKQVAAETRGRHDWNKIEDEPAPAGPDGRDDRP